MNFSVSPINFKGLYSVRGNEKQLNDYKSIMKDKEAEGVNVEFYDALPCTKPLVYGELLVGTGDDAVAVKELSCQTALIKECNDLKNSPFDTYKRLCFFTDKLVPAYDYRSLKCSIKNGEFNPATGEYKKQ